MKLKKSDYKYLIILVCLIIVTLILYNINTKNDNNDNKLENNKIKLVDNYSRFFTVNSNINKFIIFLQSKDTNSLLEILDDDFKTENNINENNIYNYFPKLDQESYSFTARKMYFEELSNNYYKFYVKGELNQETIDESNFISNYYFIVKMDTEKRIFSISPINNNEFLEVTNEK